MDEIKISHSPRVSKDVPLAPEGGQRVMNFGECLKEMVNGGKFRRMEWENPATYLTLQNTRLMIFTPSDKNLHPLTVSEGDILGEDWVKIG